VEEDLKWAIAEIENLETDVKGVHERRMAFPLLAGAKIRDANQPDALS